MDSKLIDAFMVPRYFSP